MECLEKIWQAIFSLVASKLHCSLNFTHQWNDGVVAGLESFLFPCPSVDQIISLGTFRVWDIYALNISVINLSRISILDFLTLKLFLRLEYPGSQSTWESYIKSYLIKINSKFEFLVWVDVYFRGPFPMLHGRKDFRQKLFNDQFH